MSLIRILACTLLLAPLAACQGSEPSPPAQSGSPASAQAPESALGRAVEKEIRKARDRLATENVSISGGIRFNGRGGVSVDSRADDDNRPPAEITPGGDLLVDGRKVAVTEDQRAMLLEYRAHVVGVAENGMEIGVQGADLAARAMGEAFKGLFSGRSEQEIEKSVEAEAAKIKLSAAKLCNRLPAMLASQQQLAAALPAFRPYATMTQADIDDCMKDSKDDGVRQAQLQSEIRDGIRGTVRGAVRGAMRQDDNTAAAAEAEAAATETPATH